MSKHKQKEHSTEAAAKALAASMERYWAARGRAIRTHVATTAEFGEFGSDASAGGPLYVIRSNMVNGWPPADPNHPIITQRERSAMTARTRSRRLLGV